MSFDEILQKISNVSHLQKTARDKDDWDLRRKLEFNRRLEARLMKDVEKFAMAHDEDDSSSAVG